MAFWIVLLFTFLAPVIGLGILIFLIQWIQDRLGFDPFKDSQENLNQMHFSGDEFRIKSKPQRESKATPHYDALVEAEWRAQRLELDEEAFENSDDEERSLGELLEKKKR